VSELRVVALASKVQVKKATIWWRYYSTRCVTPRKSHGTTICDRHEQSGL